MKALLLCGEPACFDIVMHSQLPILEVVARLLQGLGKGPAKFMHFIDALLGIQLP